MLNKATILQGDSLSVLKTLPSDSVHCVITSPPYWGLRDYGVAGQVGLEPTFGEFLENMVALFAEVKRVLHPSGSLWLNMGDSYNSAQSRGTFGDQSKHGYSDHGSKRPTIKKLSKKDRLGQPHRLVFALQDAGWIWRDEIIWYKPNTMPSSVRDRTTPAHEPLFLLTRRERYFYDRLAIQEPSVSDHPSGNNFVRPAQLVRRNPDGSNRGNEEQWEQCETRNKRSVWTIPTFACPEAHFATYPPKLVEPCVMAGSSEYGCCSKCLTPWHRIVEKVKVKADNGNRKRADAAGAEVSASSVFRTGEYFKYKTVGWQPWCKCGDVPRIACTVLDPFSGTGTTGLVATRLQRDYIGIELNPEYAEMSRSRIAADRPLLTQVEVVACES